MKTFKNSAPNQVLTVNEPEKQEFSLKKRKFQHFFDCDGRLLGFFFKFPTLLLRESYIHLYGEWVQASKTATTTTVE
jgi:hypothetical protein